MSVEEIPEMSVSDLEKVLSYLPEPRHVEVYLTGCIDYSGFSKLAGIELTMGSELPKFRLASPSKESVIKIYNEQERRLKEAVDSSDGMVVSFAKAEWYKDRVQIEVTPWNVKVEYHGKEPEYITRMREAVSETTVRLEILVNN